MNVTTSESKLNLNDQAQSLPHSIESEQAVLGGLMLDNEAWEGVAERLSEDDFYRSEHRVIFRAFSALANRAAPFDVLTLSDSLKQQNQLHNANGEGYLFELAKNTPTAANILAYADIVRERSILRQLVAAANEIANQTYKPD
jgi:replicative DNA helicase